MTDPSALFAAAQAHYRAGRQNEAGERCVRLLTDNPRHDGALHLMGLIAYQGGARENAAELFAQAAALALARGDADTALQRAVEALTAAETSQTRRLFADIATALRFSQDDPIVRALLTRAIAEEWGPLAPLAQAAAGLVRHALAQGADLENDALLRAALPAAPVTDAVLEDVLTAARRKLLAGDGNAAFAAALARQCFLNGYAFWQEAEETAQADALRARIDAKRAAGDVVADAELAALACYMPLHELAGASKLTDSAAMAALLLQQQIEPTEEKRIAAALPVLTPLASADHDADDLHPLWHGIPSAEATVALRDYLGGRFPAADLGDLPEKPDMLAAGCGTGQYALHLARSLTLGEVIAIDLGRATLAYAARKAGEAGMAIRFGQGDILQAAALGKSFGLIECGGVLHQLDDPMAGWVALVAVLAPGGVMRIAVHSAVAQQVFAPMRARIDRHGFTATPYGIRAARHWLKAQGDASLTPMLEAPVFFTQGGCRHLLFGNQEHPLTFREIAAFLADHELDLIGLDVAAPVLAAYHARFSRDVAATDLDNWAAFEQENPETFAAMIQFWVHKRG